MDSFWNLFKKKKKVFVDFLKYLNYSPIKKKKKNIVWNKKYKMTILENTFWRKYSLTMRLSKT